MTVCRSTHAARSERVSAQVARRSGGGRHFTLFTIGSHRVEGSRTALIPSPPGEAGTALRGE